MAEVGTAFVSILPSARGFGAATEKQVSGEMGSAGKRVGSRFGSALKVGAMGILGGLAAGGALIKGAFAEAQDAAKVGAQTAAVIKSTGGVAGVTAKHVDELSTALSNKIGVDDEAIAAGQNMLLTFSKVRNEVGKGNDIFDRATVTASDMAAAFGGDAVSNSKMLGKALNDPTKGVSALTRVGVSFTQQQKDQITALQESGDMLGAQKIIMGEVEKQTAGSAEAQATASDKMQVAWGNLQEKLGTALMPMFERVFDFVTTTIIPGAERLGEIVGNVLAPRFMSLADTVGDAVGPVLRSVGGWIRDTLMPALSNFARDIMPALKDAWRSVGDAIQAAQPFFRLVGDLVTDVLLPVLGRLARIVLPLLGDALQVVGEFLGKVGEAGRWMWNNVLQPVFRLFVDAIAKVLKFFGKMLQVIGMAPKMGWVGELGDKMVEAGEDAEGLKNKIVDIPDRHTTKITIDDSQARSAFAWFFSSLERANNANIPGPGGGGGGGGNGGDRDNNPLTPGRMSLSTLSVEPTYPSGSDGGGSVGRASGKTVRITNWRDGLGYLEDVANGVFEDNLALAAERGRARR